jgi:hypothetical protein
VDGFFELSLKVAGDLRERLEEGVSIISGGVSLPLLVRGSLRRGLCFHVCVEARLDERSRLAVVGDGVGGQT